MIIIVKTHHSRNVYVICYNLHVHFGLGPHQWSACIINQSNCKRNY